VRGLIPWNRVVAALAVLQVAAGIIEVDVTLFGAFMRSMGAGSEVLGLVLGLGYGAAVLGSLAGGRLADQVGPRSWLLLCLALVSAGLAVQGASASWLVAALGFLLVQGAQAALRPAALRLLADAAWEQMGSVLGFLSSTYSAVAIGGALLAGWLAQEVGWWAVFLAKAALHLLALVTLAVLLPSPRGKPGGTALRAEKKDWTDLLEHAPLRYIYAAAIAGAVLGYAPSFLAYDPRLAGSTLVLAGFAAIYNAAWLLGGWPAGLLGDRFGRWRIVVGGYTAAGLAWLLFPWQRELAQLYLLYALHCLGSVASSYIELLAVEKAPPERQGQVVGLLNALRLAGSAAGEGFGGILWRAVGAEASYLLAGTGMGAAALLLYRARAVGLTRPAAAAPASPPSPSARSTSSP
jgi:MFS family permease